MAGNNNEVTYALLGTSASDIKGTDDGDEIFGTPNTDFIRPGAGDDYIMTGEGRDLVKIDLAKGGLKTVADLNPAQGDRIIIEGFNREFLAKVGFKGSVTEIDDVKKVLDAAGITLENADEVMSGLTAKLNLKGPFTDIEIKAKQASATSK